MTESIDAHLASIFDALTEGILVLFFGAGVNLCGRPPESTWPDGAGRYLPSGRELAEYWASKKGYPGEDPENLLRVSQYVAWEAGRGGLNRELFKVFAGEYEPTPVHRFFARLPARLRAKGYPPDHAACNPIVFTTNYDDLLEKAFDDEGVAFDVLTYQGDSGRFVHRTAEGEEQTVSKPNSYDRLPLGRRPLLVKVHGAVVRADRAAGSYVITEDDYIEYMSRAYGGKFLPNLLEEKLKDRHFLFLGYSLRDWNLRVILHRLWSKRSRQSGELHKSWAVQLHADPLERNFWQDRKQVHLVDGSLRELVDKLTACLDEMAPLTEAATGP